MAAIPEGIINPPIDDLLKECNSKYGLVIYASKRARQVNDYYSDLQNANMFDNVGPLVDSNVDDEALSIALREIAEGDLVLSKVDRVAEAKAAAKRKAQLDAINMSLIASNDDSAADDSAAAVAESVDFSDGEAE